VLKTELKIKKLKKGNNNNWN